MRRPQGGRRKQFLSIPAPLRGWVENDNLASNQGLGCSVLENWFPTASTVRLRGGALLKTSTPEPVVGLITYQSGAAQKMFAASNTSLYDVSLFPPTAAASWSQLTSGRWSYVQMAIAGQEYLVMVNGSDLAMYFDGTALQPIAETPILNVNYAGLTSTYHVGETVTGGGSGATGIVAAVIPINAVTGRLRLRSYTGTFTAGEALTGTGGGAGTVSGSQFVASAVSVQGVATNRLSHVWQHGSRLWFAEGGTTKAWYLPVDQIGGTMVSYDLGGLFAKGGSILFGAPWSYDSGSGFAERNVFVSDQGEIAVFEGEDPSSAATWSLAGRYYVGRPISPQSMQAGGDLIIVTEDGMVSMSAIVTKDRAALSKTAITFAIEPSWQRSNRSNVTGLPVQVCKHQAGGMAIVGWPHLLGSACYVVNLVTGSWAKWTGLDVQAAAVFGGLSYFGATSGEIYQFEGSGSDGGMSYACRMSMLPDPLGSPGAFKTATQARATFRALAPFNPRLSVAPDYHTRFPPAPNAAPNSSSPALWDVGLWDVARFDDAPDSESRVTATTQWQSVGSGGMAHSMQVQVTAGGDRMPDAELVAFDVAFIPGGHIV